MDHDVPFPVKPGDWVESRSGSGDVATVRAVYRIGGDVLVDLVLYDRDGGKVGRRSPACGGPRSFEPACNYDDWQRISEPEFPIPLKWVVTEDGKRTARYVAGTVQPDRSWLPRKRKVAPRVPRVRVGNFDPAVEIAALRRSAQELRDASRAIGGNDTLIQRAEALDAEAKSLEG